MVKRFFWLLWSMNTDEQIRMFGAWWGGSIFFICLSTTVFGNSYEMGWQFWSSLAMGTALALWLILTDVAKRLEKEHGRKESSDDDHSRI